ncbi:MULTISPECIES: hypothetical protein [Exiguobacterium]|uniref:hypothetical protein n=1 Tax=Exiguobacterium TaxID=33986 RepID=UPI001BEB26C1|nr:MULTISPECIES: hypothetical protein [Exiguobacterium]MCT4781772.1 hypothetical protein [Exiguobacterium himgiriensis]
MTRKSKVVVALVTALIGVVIVFTGMYWFTIGHTERAKEAMIVEARERLDSEQPGEVVNQATLYNGTEPYVVFENDDRLLFVPVDEDLPIVVRDLTNVDLNQICNASVAETGGTLVSCKYGFDERALVEVVTKANASYTYSYYTLQTGEFIRRVELTDASL